MESFSISVDLSSFFDDFRAKSVVLVDTGSMKKVKHVEKHIKTLFGIDSKTYVFSLNNFVPSAEDSRVLKTLSSIRLETSSSLSGKATDHQNGNEEHEDVIPALNTQCKLGEIPNSDLGQILDPGHSSVKEKIKKKPVDKDAPTPEYSFVLPGSSNEFVSTPMNQSSSKAGQVIKPTSSEPRHLSTKANLLVDSNSADKRKRNETPNVVFYDNFYDELQANARRLMDESQQKNRGSSSANSCKISKIPDVHSTRNINKTAMDQENSDSNTNSEVLSSKRKRKRIRKRKNAAEPETPTQYAQRPALKIVKRSASVMSDVSTVSSKHIFFPEEKVAEDLQTSSKLPEEEKMDTEDARGSTLLVDTSIQAEWGEEVRNPPGISGDPVENNGTDILPTAKPPIKESVTKPKSYSLHASKSLGALLSLIRSGDPPVFERKKIVKNDPAAAPRQEVEVPKVSKPKSPIRFPSESLQAPAFLLDKDPSEILLTPLKTVPEVNMKISFQILKMSASYCPELSNAIVAVVKEVDPGTRDLTLKIISGGEECQKPKGKFDLQDPEATEGETAVEEIILNWTELIEPSVCL